MDTNSLIDEMYSRYAKALKLYLLTLCGNNELADDITAETFLKAINNIDSFRGGNVFTWLCTIGKNTYFDYLRKKERTNVFPADTEILQTASKEPAPEESLIQKDERIMLYRLLRGLEQDAREVVYLRMFTDLSFKEIGSVLNKSENWARVTFYRSKVKLKGMIENED
ncbi:MAG: RNA polymerase sigma factor [Bacillota bacterium]